MVLCNIQDGAWKKFYQIFQQDTFEVRPVDDVTFSPCYNSLDIPFNEILRNSNLNDLNHYILASQYGVNNHAP